MPIKLNIKYKENDAFFFDKDSEPVYFDKIISFKKIEGEKRSYEITYKTHLMSLSWVKTTKLTKKAQILLNNQVYISKADMKLLIEMFKENKQ